MRTLSLTMLPAALLALASAACGGTVPVGDACGKPADCVGGATCVLKAGGGGGVCATTCDVDGGCSGGETCQSVSVFGCRGPIDMQVRMMARDHDDHAKHLERVRKQTANLTAPADASAEWTKLYANLVTLEAALRQHMYLEDNILFARAVGG